MFKNERFYFKILSVLTLKFAPSTRYAPPRAYNVLVFRKSGNADVIRQDQLYSLSKNNVTFIPKGYDYTISTKLDEEVIVIHFDAEIENGKNFINFTAKRPEQILSLFEQCLSTWIQKPVGFTYKLDSLFSAILENLERQAVENYTSLLELAIQRSVDQMHIHLSDPELSIEQLASYTGYTPSYFRRAFRRFTGKSPIDYLMELRIEHATSLLEAGYYTVEQVAAFCGFESTKYFSTFYKQHTGVSPSKIIPKPNK